MNPTENVALWILNEERLYRLSRECASYAEFRAAIREVAQGTPLAYETPDGTAWSDSGIDADALDDDVFGEEE